MEPVVRRNQDRRALIRSDHREGAVLILLYPNWKGELCLVLIRRPEYNGVHSGQIALPGGGREADESLQTTALREAHEEIGISQKRITVLGNLSSIYIPVSNFLVYPYVAFHPDYPSFNPDPQEVAEIIEVPLQLFLDETTVRSEMRNHVSLGLTEIPYFAILGHKVWGATAMILSEFIEIL
jgi:8-oxo-dGTP pyrophosphatase MutT (NUDIX family)